MAEKSAAKKTKKMGSGRLLNQRNLEVGGRRPRDVVVTVTVAEPFVSDIGLTEQCVAVATIEQERLTVDANPFCGETVRTFVYVAVAPALTVWEVVPEAAMVKSGGPVTVKLKGTEVPPGAGSTTYNE
jgi:hypothetical protein